MEKEQWLYLQETIKKCLTTGNLKINRKTRELVRYLYENYGVHRDEITFAVLFYYIDTDLESRFDGSSTHERYLAGVTYNYLRNFVRKVKNKQISTQDIVDPQKDTESPPEELLEFLVYKDYAKDYAPSTVNMTSLVTDSYAGSHQIPKSPEKVIQDEFIKKVLYSNLNMFDIEVLHGERSKASAAKALNISTTWYNKLLDKKIKLIKKLLKG